MKSILIVALSFFCTLSTAVYVNNQLLVKPPAKPKAAAPKVAAKSAPKAHEAPKGKAAAKTASKAHAEPKGKAAVSGGAAVGGQPTCRVWCMDHVSVWGDKCGWSGCGACSTCKESNAVKTILNVYAKTKYLQHLRHQVTTGAVVAVRKAEGQSGNCVEWCGGHLSPWETKCKWRSCGACGKCAMKPGAATSLAKSDNEKNTATYLHYLFLQAQKKNLANETKAKQGAVGHLVDPPSGAALTNAAQQFEEGWVRASLASEGGGLTNSSAIVSQSDLHHMASLAHIVPSGKQEGTDSNGAILKKQKHQEQQSGQQHHRAAPGQKQKTKK